MGSVRLQIRAATEGDAPFLVRLACEAYRDVVTLQFGGWNEGEQAARFAAKVARLPFEVGELADRPIAAVSSSVHADHVFLNETPRPAGVSEPRVRQRAARARDPRALQQGLPVRLHTLRRTGRCASSSVMASS